jgi:hypothetical protein
VGGALVALGAGTFLVGSTLPERAGPTVVRTQPVNAGATDPVDIDAHNSPSLVRNPTDTDNLAVANRIDTPRFSCALHVSFDAGASWSASEIPFPDGEEAPPRCFAPDVAFGPDGTLYVSFVTLRGAGNVPNAAWTVSSDDGGRTLSTPRAALGPLAFQVRLVADPSAAGRLYLSWLQASGTATLGFPEPGNPVRVARSDDGGATWAAPVTVSPLARQRAIAPAPAVGPDGAIYVAYLDLGDDRLDYHGAHEGQGGPPYDGPWTLVVARSGDGATTWQETVIDDAVVPIERVIVFFPPAPSVVAGDGGEVHVAFHDGRLGDADVWVWSSTDGATSFGAGTRVNDTTTGDGTAQYLPAVALAPGGRLDVVYYDRRADPDDVMNEVSYQSSSDGAQTFSARLTLTDRAFDSRIGFGSERGLPDLGSRLGLVAGDSVATAVWSDTRAGTEASNKQDLGQATVEVSNTSPFRTPSLVLGPLIVVAGLAALARSTRGAVGVSQAR